MKILLVGGGSGGHVTPLKAILPHFPKGKVKEIYLVTDRKFYHQTLGLFKDEKNVKIKKIFAGKYRRYHGHSFFWHLTHLPTLLYNLRDIFYLSIGFLQSCLHFVLHRPDVVCAKGGFVSLPVGLAAKIFRVPLVIHDSDTHPGLTSRVLSRWATAIATGMPTRYYPYPAEKMKYIGIPVDDRYVPVSSRKSRGEKATLGLAEDRPLLLITGGGTGAKRLNQYFTQCASRLIDDGWSVALITGKGKSQEAATRRNIVPQSIAKHWQIHEFTDLAPFVIAADIVVSRAGASAMQEFANSKKPVIVVPSAVLSGGHQVKNAQMFAEHDAAYYIKEADLISGKVDIIDVVSDMRGDKGSKMATRLHKEFARPQAAKMFAEAVIEAIK